MALARRLPHSQIRAPIEILLHRQQSRHTGRNPFRQSSRWTSDACGILEVFNIRIQAGRDLASVYQISLDEAVRLRRELTDFLAMQIVPANY